MHKLSEIAVNLERDGHHTPWGIRLVGGSDLDTPLIITKVWGGVELPVKVNQLSRRGSNSAFQRQGVMAVVMFRRRRRGDGRSGQKTNGP